MRIYIAGPMTGLPEYNFPVFNAAAEAWRAAGWEVLNPAEAFDGDTTRTYREYVVHDLALLRRCDAIAMLPGWDGEGARGSVWEREVAVTLLGLAVYDADDVVPPSEHPRGETILQEAQRLVHGDRGADYGHPLDDYTRTGALWGAILHEWAKLAGASSRPRPIPARVAALCMAALKISREVNRHKRDNLTDLAGYAECASMIAAEERRRSGEA